MCVVIKYRYLPSVYRLFIATESTTIHCNIDFFSHLQWRTCSFHFLLFGPQSLWLHLYIAFVFLYINQKEMTHFLLTTKVNTYTLLRKALTNLIMHGKTTRKQVESLPEGFGVRRQSTSAGTETNKPTLKKTLAIFLGNCFFNCQPTQCCCSCPQ